MNVYDFDGTILDGDTEVYFFQYLVNKKLVKGFLKLRILIILLFRNVRIGGPSHLFTDIYPHLSYLRNKNKLLDDFWNEHRKYIKDFYEELHKDDDVISSATPDFLLIPIVKQLGVKTLIASEGQLETMTIQRWNYTEEKVISFKKKFPNTEIDNFYSDSDNDIPMAKFAKNAFRVTGNKIEPWKF